MQKPFNQNTADLWTPDGAEKMSPSIVGENLKGKPIVQHTIMFHSKKYDRKERIVIAADDTFSKAEIEDAMAQAMENTLIRWEEQRQEKVGLHTPSREERLEVGAALREYRAHAQIRKESTNERIFYPVVKVGTNG